MYFSPFFFFFCRFFFFFFFCCCYDCFFVKDSGFFFQEIWHKISDGSRLLATDAFRDRFILAHRVKCNKKFYSFPQAMSKMKIKMKMEPK